VPPPPLALLVAPPGSPSRRGRATQESPSRARVEPALGGRELPRDRERRAAPAVRRPRRCRIGGRSLATAHSSRWSKQPIASRPLPTPIWQNQSLRAWATPFATARRAARRGCPAAQRVAPISRASTNGGRACGQPPRSEECSNPSEQAPGRPARMAAARSPPKHHVRALALARSRSRSRFPPLPSPLLSSALAQT